MEEVPPKLDYVPKMIDANTLRKPGELPSWVWPVVLCSGIVIFLAFVLWILFTEFIVASGPWP